MFQVHFFDIFKSFLRYLNSCFCILFYWSCWKIPPILTTDNFLPFTLSSSILCETFWYPAFRGNIVSRCSTKHKTRDFYSKRQTRLNAQWLFAYHPKAHCTTLQEACTRFEDSIGDWFLLHLSPGQLELWWFFIISQTVSNFTNFSSQL